jgi:Uma2 family endonuclease
MISQVHRFPRLMWKGCEIMAMPDTLPTFTPDEYLAFERSSESKHEYPDGLIYAMAGSSPEHSTICVNVSEVITRQLRGTPCRPFSADMKLRCLSAPTTTGRRRGLFAYPDLIVVCGEPVFHDAQRDVLVNPTLIVEVRYLSGSLFIASINCHLPLAEVYEWVPFPTSD